MEIFDKETDWFLRGQGKRDNNLRTHKSDINRDHGRHRLSGVYTSLLRGKLSSVLRHRATVHHRGGPSPVEHEIHQSYNTVNEKHCYRSFKNDLYRA